MIRLFIIGLFLLMPLTAISQPPPLQDGVGDHRASNKPKSTSKDNQNISNAATSISYKDPHAALQTKETCTCTRNADQQPAIDSSFFTRLAHDITGTATIFLTMVTLALVCVTLYQSTLLRRELILTQRPKLRVNSVIVKRPNILNADELSKVGFDKADGVREIFMKGHHVHGQFYIANVGGTPATIGNIGCWVYWTKYALPMERPYEGQNGNIFIKSVLNPGESIPITFQNEIPLDIDGNLIIVGTYMLYVMGWIEYSDDLKINRRINFCRRYWPGKRFEAVIDDDYETYQGD